MEQNQCAVRFQRALFTIGLTLVLSEAFVRLHHGLVYGVWRPMGERGVIFYSSRSKQMADEFLPVQSDATSSRSFSFIWSGGSVAAGYGHDGDRPAVFLEETLNLNILDLAHPGRLLIEEIEQVKMHLKADSEVRQVIFLTGFNDFGGTAEFRARQKCVLTYPGTGSSLFLRKAVQRLCQKQATVLNPNEAIEELESLIKDYPDTSFTLFVQPVRKTGDQGFISRRRRWIQKLSGASIRWLDTQPLFEEPAMQKEFLDACHLSEKGQKTLLEWVSEHLRGSTGLGSEARVQNRD